MNKVICTNAKLCPRAGLGGCIHSGPHERQDPYEGLLDEVMFCTQWDECLIPHPPRSVRCTKVKS
jgi:hypothetical protein